MKKIFVLLLFLGTSFFGFGQDFGLRAGINLADVSTDGFETGLKSGIQIGPVVEFDFTDNLALNLGVLYGSKGFKDTASDISSNYGYLDIPVLLHLSFSPIFIEMGPNFSYLLSAKAGDLDIADQLKNFDLSFVVGGGVDLGPLRVDARYGLGVTNISDVTGQSFSPKNKVITLAATFFF